MKAGFWTILRRLMLMIAKLVLIMDARQCHCGICATRQCQAYSGRISGSWQTFLALPNAAAEPALRRKQKRGYIAEIPVASGFPRGK
jgi:hypothetical protein